MRLIRSDNPMNCAYKSGTKYLVAYNRHGKYAVLPYLPLGIKIEDVDQDIKEDDKVVTLKDLRKKYYTKGKVKPIKCTLSEIDMYTSAQNEEEFKNKVLNTFGFEPVRFAIKGNTNHKELPVIFGDKKVHTCATNVHLKELEGRKSIIDDYRQDRPGSPFQIDMDKFYNSSHAVDYLEKVKKEYIGFLFSENGYRELNREGLINYHFHQEVEGYKFLPSKRDFEAMDIEKQVHTLLDKKVVHSDKKEYIYKLGKIDRLRKLHSIPLVGLYIDSYAKSDSKSMNKYAIEIEKEAKIDIEKIDSLINSNTRFLNDYNLFRKFICLSSSSKQKEEVEEIEEDHQYTLDEYLDQEEDHQYTLDEYLDQEEENPILSLSDNVSDRVYSNYHYHQGNFSDMVDEIMRDVSLDDMNESDIKFLTMRKNKK